MDKEKFENIKQVIEGICPSCLKENPPYSEFVNLKYKAPQETLEKGKFIQLYDCMRCGSTISLQSIEEANKIVKKSLKD